MSSLRHLSIALLYCSAAVVFSLDAVGQTVTPQGGEFPLLESTAVRGDQTAPSVSLSAAGGYIVWQDNAIDGSGFGIGARYIDSSFSPGVFASFRVNQQVAGSQQRPQVATLPGGGAAFVWQGGASGSQNIYIRFIGPNRTFLSATDLRVNVFTNGDQTAPTVAALFNGNAVVVWSSLNQDGSLQGVYARLVRTNGQFATAPFQVNQFTSNNQRNPGVAVASNGNFIVVWSSDGQFGPNNVDILGRIYNSTGAALGGEFQINSGASVCATPAVSFFESGGFTVTWAQRFGVDTNGWDIYARTFGSDGTSSALPFPVNTFTYGDQYLPKISTAGRNQLVVWTSIGEDGSQEGVFGQLLSDGTIAGQPFLINTTTVSKQMDPSVTSDGSSQFLVAWTGFVGITNGFDVFGRRYASGAPLPTPDALFVSALSSSQLGVSWSPLVGYPISYYELYMDVATAPNATATVTNGNYWVAGGLSPATSHSFRLAYVVSGNRSALSASSSGRTWGADLSGRDGVPDGLPDDWETMYWGVKAALWPSPSDDSDGDGVSNIKEFLAGTNPMDRNSVLKMWFTSTPFGRRLNWNTTRGVIYQVQVSNDLNGWSNLGDPRLAAGATDSMAVTGSQRAEYYRVLRMR